MERVKGIEPSYEAWEAAVLPLNYTRSTGAVYQGMAHRCTPTPGTKPVMSTPRDCSMLRMAPRS
jgi:hypothetical protein